MTGIRARSFAPTVLLGLGGATLAAVAAAQEWATARGTATGVPVSGSATGAESSPQALALALVALAGWGVVLVLRGRVRIVVAVVGLVASAGVLATVATGSGDARSAAREAVTASGATSAVLSAAVTGWYWAAGVGALLSLLAFAVAAVRAARWPAMGARYDAPTAPTPVQDRDLWRALDEGRDPTA